VLFRDGTRRSGLKQVQTRREARGHGVARSPTDVAVQPAWMPADSLQSRAPRGGPPSPRPDGKAGSRHALRSTRVARAAGCPGRRRTLGLVVFAYLSGAESLVSTLTRIMWWQFGLVCAVYGVGVIADTFGWRYALGRGQSPRFLRLLAAKCGEAVNVVTALGSVGGEAIKAWLLRRDVPYEASVPSMIVAKTSLVLAQAPDRRGILVAWTTGAGGPTLLLAMSALLVVEVIGVGGFLGVQLGGGVVGRPPRPRAAAGSRPAPVLPPRVAVLPPLGGLPLRGLAGGAVEAFLILAALGLPASLVVATVIEAHGSGVRFATFFVPASLGALEGANAGAFGALGWAASAGWRSPSCAAPVRPSGSGSASRSSWRRTPAASSPARPSGPCRPAGADEGPSRRLAVPHRRSVGGRGECLVEGSSPVGRDQDREHTGSHLQVLSGRGGGDH
jgi:hypothetical protein